MSLPGLLPEAEQLPQLPLAADQRCQPECHTCPVEAGSGPSLAQHLIHALRAGGGLPDRGRHLEGFQLEGATHQGAGGFAEEHPTGLGLPGQPGDPLRGLSRDDGCARSGSDGALVQSHPVRVKTDLHGEPRWQRARQLPPQPLRESLAQEQARLDGTLGVLLVGMRIAKTGQHLGAHGRHDRATAAAEDLRAAILEGGLQLVPVVRVERLGEPYRHAAHQRHLPALGREGPYRLAVQPEVLTQLAKSLQELLARGQPPSRILGQHRGQQRLHLPGQLRAELAHRGEGLRR